MTIIRLEKQKNGKSRFFINKAELIVMLPLNHQQMFQQ